MMGLMLLYHWLVDAADKHGIAKAIVYRDTYLSWRSLLDRVDRRARELSSLGIEDGHFVGLMLGNVPDFLVLTLALSKLNATLVPIDPTTGVRELQMFLSVLPLRALITRPRGGTDPGMATPTLTRGRSKLAKIPEPALGIEPTSRKRLQNTLLTCLLFSQEPVDTNHAPVVFVTNDFLGQVKGVVRTQQNLLFHSVALYQALTMSEEDRLLALLPLHQAYGFEINLLLALRYGITLHLEEEITPSRIAKLLREQEINVVAGIPSIYLSLSRMRVSPPKLTAPRPRFLSSGTPLPASVARAFAEKFGPKLMSVYRSTEAGILSGDFTGEHPETVGTPLPGVQLRLNAKQGIWAQSPGISTIQILSPLSEQAYARIAETPIFTLDDKDWFRTGDKGFWDEQGRLVLQGREDDVVKIEEKRVALLEVVRCLQAHPAVAQAQVRCQTSADGVPLLVARVLQSRPCTEEELLDHCTKLLPPYKMPRRIVWAKEE